MYGTICERTSDSTRWNGVSGSDSGFAAVNPCPCKCDLERRPECWLSGASGNTLQGGASSQSERFVTSRSRKASQLCVFLPKNALGKLRWDRPPGLSFCGLRCHTGNPEGAALFLTWRLHGSLPRTVEILERSPPGKVFVRHRPAWPRWLPMRSGSGGLVYLYHLDLSRGPACRGSPRPSIKNHSARQANAILGRTGLPFWQDESYRPLLAQRPPEQRLDYRLPADIEPRRTLVEFAHHPLSQVDVHATHRPDHSEPVGEVGRNIVTRRRRVCDLIGSAFRLRRFRHSLLFLLIRSPGCNRVVVSPSESCLISKIAEHRRPWRHPIARNCFGSFAREPFPKPRTLCPCAAPPPPPS